MKNKAALFGIYLPIFALILPTAVVLRVIASFKHLDAYGYFSEAPLIVTSYVLTTVGVVFFLTYIFTARKDLKLIPSFASPLSYAPGAIVAIALCLLGAKLLSDALFNGEIVNYLSAATGILAFSGAGYFLLAALIDRRRSIKRANFSLLMLIFLCAYITCIYFDASRPLNSPAKTVDEMAYLSVAIFFLYESRLTLGRERWRHYIAFGFISSLLTAYSSIPTLILYFTDGRMISNSLEEALLTFTLFIFSTAKLLLTGNLIEEKKSPVIEKLIAAANARSEEINPEPDETEHLDSDEISEAGDENQISIADINTDEEIENASPDKNSGEENEEETTE